MADDDLYFVKQWDNTCPSCQKPNSYEETVYGNKKKEIKYECGHNFIEDSVDLTTINCPDCGKGSFKDKRISGDPLKGNYPIIYDYTCGHKRQIEHVKSSNLYKVGIPPNPKKYDVFISHSKYDTEQAFKVYDALTKAGLKCWIDKTGLSGGVNYPDVMGAALLDSKLLVLVYSSNTNRSKIVKNEISMAIEADIPVISFRLENADYSPGLKIFINTSQYINAFPGYYEDHIPQLNDDINHHLKSFNSPGTINPSYIRKTVFADGGTSTHNTNQQELSDDNSPSASKTISPNSSVDDRIIKFKVIVDSKSVEIHAHMIKDGENRYNIEMKYVSGVGKVFINSFYMGDSSKPQSGYIKKVGDELILSYNPTAPRELPEERAFIELYQRREGGNIIGGIKYYPDDCSYKNI